MHAMSFPSRIHNTIGKGAGNFENMASITICNMIWLEIPFHINFIIAILLHSHIRTKSRLSQLWNQRQREVFLNEMCHPVGLAGLRLRQAEAQWRFDCRLVGVWQQIMHHLNIKLHSTAHSKSLLPMKTIAKLRWAPRRLKWFAGWR